MALVQTTGRASRAAVPASRARRRMRRSGWLLVILLGASALSAGVLCGSLPSVGDALTRVKEITAHDGSRPVPISRSEKIALAVVATEDERFYDHGALDLVSLGRVALSTVTAGSVDPGGSTISQQLAKVLYVAHPNSGLGRLQAIGLAAKIEARYSKAQILTMYLNAIYFGHGFYGIRAASLGYFGKAPDALNWSQASLLAGLPQAPSAYDPLTHLGLARQRQREVLAQLVDTGSLTRMRAAAIARQPLSLRRPG